MQIAGDIVVKAQDWPGAEELSERLQKTIPPQLLSEKEKAEMGEQAPNMQAIMQQGQQMQEMIQQGQQELQKLQQENLVLKAKHDIESEKLTIEKFRAETDRLTAYANIAKTDEEFNLQKLEHQAHVALTLEEQEITRDGQEAAQEQATSDSSASTQPTD
jgi:hypothetical protein